MNRIGNLTRLICTLLYVITTHAYVYTVACTLNSRLLSGHLEVVAGTLRRFLLGDGQKREYPVLFWPKTDVPENNSGRECCWPYLIGQHPLSPVFGQKQPGTPGNSYFAQLSPVFGHFLFRFWPYYVPFRWATRLLEQINMGQNLAQVTWFVILLKNSGY